jgi:5S rRNA maturation endonuclease (ribonuclease M5)
VCPNPEHSGGNETKPSFSIFLEGPNMGQGRCWSCGHRLGWRELVLELGLPRSAKFLTEDFSNTVNQDEEDQMLGRRRIVGTGETMPWSSSSEWRGVNGRLVARVGGQLVPSKRGNALLRLPVVILGTQVGHIDCTLEKPPEGELGYLNSTGNWARSSLYPYDYVRKRNPRVLVLVEGARDALVTIQNKVMALAALGSENWNDRCVKLVTRVAPELVVIMTDPDDAGERLMKSMYRDLHDRLECRNVVLPSRVVEGKRTKIYDPADLNFAKLTKVFARVGVVWRDGEWVGE